MDSFLLPSVSVSMDSLDCLTSSFGEASLGGAVPVLEKETHLIYISEVSSLTRFWFQASNNALCQLEFELDSFYGSDESGRVELNLNPVSIAKGRRIAAFVFGHWHRAEVISDFVQQSGKLKLFLYDYGTKGFVDLRSCKILMEEFSRQPKLALRGSLAEIKPRGNARLWDQKATLHFLGLIKEKKLRIKIVKHHGVDDYYEVLLFSRLCTWADDSDSDNSINKLMTLGFAEQIEQHETPHQLASPSFQMLETMSKYPTFGDRLAMLDRLKVDFNHFEEKHIAPVTDPLEFESELKKAWRNPYFAMVKNAFEVFEL